MAIEFDSNTLFASPLLRIVDIRWHAHECAPTREYLSDFAEITFQRRGMFFKHHGPGGVACDPNTLLFINAHEPYRLSHPTTMDCACTALLINPSVLAEILRRSGGKTPSDERQLLKIEQCPTQPDFALAHNRLFSLANMNGAVEPIAVEELGLTLAERAIQAARRINNRCRRQKLRPATSRAHADLADGVREYLATHLGERITLAQIAQYVHSDPAHLCRIFKAQTGTQIHRYLTRLRLAAAVDRLADADDLTGLALQLGFAHHSHFTTVFRKEFGLPPSRMRRLLRPDTARQIRKNVQA